MSPDSLRGKEAVRKSTYKRNLFPIVRIVLFYGGSVVIITVNLSVTAVIVMLYIVWGSLTGLCA